MSRFMLCLGVVCVALTGGLTSRRSPSVIAAEPATKGPVSFIKDVAPILKENCFACHDARKRKGKLDMTTFENLRKGGTNDDPIVPGKPDESLIVDMIAAKGAKRMPPKESGDPLPPPKVAIIEQWIKEGAKLDGGLTPKADLLRELRVRWQPPAPPAAYRFPVSVTALAFTPDAKKLVAGGHHELTVWDIAAGKLEKRIATRAERAKAMAFLPDGKLVVAGGRPGQEGDLRIYDVSGGKSKMVNSVAILDGVHDSTVMLKQLLDSDDEVLCLAVSADGKKLASGGCDRTVHVWDLGQAHGSQSVGFRLEQKIENHADWVLGVAFSPDSKHLLTASRDKTAKVWDLEKKESLLTFPDHQNTVYAVAVKPDGKIGYSVGADKQLRAWNATGDGKQVRAMAGHGNEVFRVLYDAKAKPPLLVTCGADNSVRVWNDNGAALRTLTGHSDWVYALALSPDGTQVASGAWNGEVRVWKLADGSVVKAFNASPGLAQAVTAK